MSVNPETEARRVLPGIDNGIPAGLRGKRAALIINGTGVSAFGESTIDIINKECRLVRLFAPEHGIRGEFEAGIRFESYTDEFTGVPVVSLYGENRRPSREMLENVEALLFDIQDAGSRFYTYLYTMAYAMEACAQYGIPFYVFDRPNPLGAERVCGGTLDTDFRSFVGYYPIPQRYGLTIGEAARLFNAEFGINCDLTVIPMQNYKRDMLYEDTGLIWVAPSPNLPSAQSALLYCGTCVFEGTNVSEGRGTTKPFQYIGAPWLNAKKLADAANEQNLPGVFFRPQCFTPLFSKHKDVFCRGVEVHITDNRRADAVKAAVGLLYLIRDMYPQFEYLPPVRGGGKRMIDLLTGSDRVRSGRFTADELFGMYDKESEEFKEVKVKYHIY